MNKQQEFLLTMLKEIHDICTRHDIKYALIGGTLIGAVRNGGFLPWDDDADIAMPYEDYLRFAEVCKEETPPHRMLISPTIDENYRKVIPRWMSTDTTDIHTTSSLHDDIAGELIDIFVLDPIGDSDESWRNFTYNLHLYNSIVNYSNANGARFEVDPEEYRHYLALSKSKGQAYVNNLLEQRMVDGFDQNGHDYAERWKGFPTRMPRAWFETTIPVTFEGVELQAPCRYGDFLRLFYGEEWFMLPTKITPAKHRTACSLRMPSHEAKELFQPQYNLDELLHESEERIDIRLELAKDANNLRDLRARLRADATSRDLREHISAHREAFDKALSRRDGHELARILDWYLAVQTSKPMIGRPFDSGVYRYFRPILVDADPDVFGAALLAFMTTGRVQYARRLLHIADGTGMAQTPLAREINGHVGVFLESVNAYEDGNWEKGLAAARTLQAAYPDSAEFCMLVCANLAALWHQANDEEARAQLADTVREARVAFPDDGFFMKQEADLLESSIDDNDLLVRYIQAAEQTNIGLTLSSIAQKSGYYQKRLREPGWAKTAGVPQWPADKPQPAPIKSVKREAPYLSPVATRLFELLCEVVHTCDDLNIPYTLSPQLAKALLVNHEVPATPGDYAIFVRADQMKRLVQALPSAKRVINMCGDKLPVNDFIVRYSAEDSLYFPLTKEFDEPIGLFINIVPLENASYSSSLEQSISAWQKSGASSFTPKGRKNRFYLAFYGVDHTSGQTGTKLFEHAARKTKDARRIRAGKSVYIFPTSPLNDINKYKYGNMGFFAPRDLQGYVMNKIDDAFFALSKTESTVFASSCSYRVFTEENGISADYFAQSREIAKQNKRGDQIYKRFNANFRQLQTAVAAKEMSLDLLPRKEEIIKLSEEGDVAALKKILNPYIKLMSRPDACATKPFDEEIEAIVKAISG